MDLQEKSLKILDLPAILDMLAGEAVSEAAKFAARSLLPSTDIHNVKSIQEETTAAKYMMSLKNSPPFSGVKDVRSVVRRADMGGMLNTRELLDIAGLLRASAASIAFYAGFKEAGLSKTSVNNLFMTLVSNKDLENKISSAIASEEEITDNASSELSKIRKHMRICSDKVRQTLSRIITSPAYSKALQEPIISMKNDRYVVPVKAEQKSVIPGLVHDISSSGATLFVEPMTVVNINNELREMGAKEKIEIDRILSELSADVAANGEDIISDFEILAALDLIFAKARLSNKLNAIEPEISENTFVKLNKARHPLLQQKQAVPIDIWLGDEHDTLVITGPNTGGKTVSLKTLGLLCAMAQCGLHIPAGEGSIVPVFSGILADIGDEQSIEQSLSTFSSHMTNIVEILDNCEPNSLLLFDEMGAGTDPVEGAALAMAIIENARKMGVLIAATTHYPELKTYAMTMEGVVNASCEFDVVTLRPTYRLIIGIPGKSNAFAISKRLGLPDEIIEDAKSRIDIDNATFDIALEHLEITRDMLEWEREEASKLLRDAEEDRQKAQEIKTKVDRELDSAASRAKREAAVILDDVRATAEGVMADLRDLQKKAATEADWQRLNEKKADVFRRLNEAERKLEESGRITEQSEGADDDLPSAPQREIVAGDRVKLIGLGTFADVLSVSPDGVLTLQAGIMKITARPNEVAFAEGEDQQEVKKQLEKSEAILRELVAKPEIDLRGLPKDEAVPILERFMENARSAKLPSVTIIHGKGTGTLRHAVHMCLKQAKGIKSFRLGRYGEGEDGVTIVEMK